MLPLAKNIMRYFSFKIVAVVMIAIVVSVLTGVGFVSYHQKDVFIDYNGSQFTVKTLKSTVIEVLEQKRIVVGENDVVSLPLDSKLKNEGLNTVYIVSAVPVNVVVDGEEMELRTCKATVKEALKDYPVNFGSNDRIEGASLYDKVVEGMKIKVIRAKSEMVSQNEIIPCKVVRKANNHMDSGKEKVVSEGRNGIKEKVFSVSYEDGVEIKRELVSERIITESENKVIEYGSLGKYTTSRGDALKYNKVLDMRATAYTASFKDTGKNPDHPEFGITYTGIKVKRGIVAVDPKVIPLGTKLFIEGVGDVPDYGYALAADIGSAVKGDIIDLYMEGQDVVDRWGVKKVKVYVLYD